MHLPITPPLDIAADRFFDSISDRAWAWNQRGEQMGDSYVDLNPMVRSGVTMLDGEICIRIKFERPVERVSDVDGHVFDAFCEAEAKVKEWKRQFFPLPVLGVPAGEVTRMQCPNGPEACK